MTEPEISQVGEYELKGLVGEGGMGLVYEGLQPKIGKRVAIKLLKRELLSEAARLLEEARVVNQIGHRGIIDIFSFGELEDGRQYFVMEFLNGVPLSSEIDLTGPMPVADVLQITEEICSALAAAHDVAVIHRDLKPSNVFIVGAPDGTAFVKLLDFGLAKKAELAGGDTPQTVASRILGTPRYMAPEQVTGDAIGPRTDLYALGILVFEMLTKTVPFNARTLVEILSKQLNHPPPAPSSVVPGLPSELDTLVAKLLEKEPGSRPPAAQVVLEEVRRIRGVLGIPSRPLTAPQSIPERTLIRRVASPSGKYDWTPSPAVLRPAGGVETRASVPAVSRAEIVLDPNVETDPVRAERTVVAAAPVANSTRLFTSHELKASSTVTVKEPKRASRGMLALGLLMLVAVAACATFLVLLIKDSPAGPSAPVALGPKTTEPGKPSAVESKPAAVEPTTPTVEARKPSEVETLKPSVGEPKPSAVEPLKPSAVDPKPSAVEWKPSAVEAPKSAAPKPATVVRAQLKRLERTEAAWLKARRSMRAEDVRLFDTVLDGMRRQSTALKDAELKAMLDDFVSNALAGSEP